MARKRPDANPDSQDVDAFAIELGSILVDEVAPDEQDDYVSLIKEYRQEISRSTTSDHPLALGIGELIQTVSPYVYEAARIMILYIVAEIGVSAKRLISDILKMTEKSLKERISIWLQENFSHNGSGALSNQQRLAILGRIETRLSELKANEKTRRSIMNEVNKLVNAK